MLAHPNEGEQQLLCVEGLYLATCNRTMSMSQNLRNTPVMRTTCYYNSILNDFFEVDPESGSTEFL